MKKKWRNGRRAMFPELQQRGIHRIDLFEPSRAKGDCSVNTIEP